MALEVESVNPVAGHTGGKTYVEIRGNGFRLPTQRPAVNGRVPPPFPAMRITFGDQPATHVEVYDEHTASCLTPIHDPTGDTAANITVETLDDDGTVIDSFTLVEAYKFVRPDLAEDSDLTRIVRAFAYELERQITPNVSWPRSVDYEDGSGDMLTEIDLAKLPSLSIASVQVRESPESDSEETEQENEDGDAVVRPPPMRLDMAFTLVGVSNRSGELWNLYAATRAFFRKNEKFEVDRSADYPEDGKVTLGLYHSFTEAQGIDVTSNSDDLKHFSVIVRLEGIMIEAMPGLPKGGPGAREKDDYEGVKGTRQKADSLEVATARRGSVP